MNANIPQDEKLLGFGLMRLPKNNGVIDIEIVCTMADAFISKGFTYFDTAYVYDGSEIAFREAVAKRHQRSSYTVATKMPPWGLEEIGGPEAAFAEQLERCGVEYFDYYLLHSLQPRYLSYFDQYNCWTFCERMKAEGKIKHFGFSFHGSPELLEQLLTKHPEVDFVQLQINYLDWESKVVCAKQCYEICRSHGKPIVIMEPIKGGLLANPSHEVKERYKALDPVASPASYALRFAASLDGVLAVLSGMSDMEQMKDNLNTFFPLKPLSDKERNVIKQATDIILSVPTIPCTDCRYCCAGCKEKINIPEIFKAVNEIRTLSENGRPRFFYAGMVASGQTAKASACSACGQCEHACPQHLDIINLLQEASLLLDQ